MSDSVNLDLDFQDYTPTGGNSTQQPRSSTTESHVRIPSSLPTNNEPGGSKVTLIPNLNTAQQSGGLSEEVIQQLIRASSKQKAKQQKATTSTSAGSWGLGYLSQYFDVTTSDVLERIIWSAIPLRKVGIDLDDAELSAPLADNMMAAGEDNQSIIDQLNSRQKSLSYMERFIQSRPDFYGPFWISTTLIFAVAIFSNLVSFLDYRSKFYQAPNDSLMLANNDTVKPASVIADNVKQPEEWHYNMDQLNTTASVITFYITVVPTLLWFLFWSRGCAKYYTLIETVCAYGYSLSIFIPLAGLLMIQEIIFRYLVLILASLLSGLVLLMSFVPIVRSDPNIASSHLILIIIPIFQFCLAYVLHRIMLM